LSGSPNREEVGSRELVRTFLLYLAAGLAYIALGIWNQNYIYSVFEGAAWLCFCVVGIPWAVRRLRR
jgi:hypothetical protein